MNQLSRRMSRADWVKLMVSICWAELSRVESSRMKKIVFDILFQFTCEQKYFLLIFLMKGLNLKKKQYNHD